MLSSFFFFSLKQKKNSLKITFVYFPSLVSVYLARLEFRQVQISCERITKIFAPVAGFQSCDCGGEPCDSQINTYPVELMNAD